MHFPRDPSTQIMPAWALKSVNITYSGLSASLRLYPARMLRVLALSGEEMTTVDLERIPAVGALKLHLQDLVQVTRLRQRILSNNTLLDDRSALVVGDVLFLRLGLCQADEDQVESFFDAAANGDVFAVEGMLQLPLDPDTWTRNGTALCEASARGQVDIVQLLLEAGADIDLADKDGTR